MMEWRVPLADLILEEEDIEAVRQVMHSKWLSMGKVTEDFEHAFQEFLGVKHAIAVTNGTAALHLAHAALDLGPGDEVIVPSLSFVATANAIVYTGAQPVFAEITGADDLNISPQEIERHITPRTKAITILHYGGYPCDMGPILACAEKHNLALIEDAAHALGAVYGGRRIGTFGDAACFSFFANKNITTGEGGMLVTNRDDIANQVRVMRSHGMTTLTWDRFRGHAHSYDVVALGYNYRIDEIRSALGLVQLRRLPEIIRERARIVQRYRNELSSLPGISMPFPENKNASSSHYIFPILVNDQRQRESLAAFLKEEGIQTSIHYPPIHLFDFYRKRFGCRKGTLPVTEEVCSRELTLPLYPTMRAGDVDLVIQFVQKGVSLTDFPEQAGRH